MGEKPPEDKYKESQRRNDIGFELVEQDKADPERGPIVWQVRAILEKARADYQGNIGFFNDLESFRESFNDHFTVAGARRYRLYHLMSGSLPRGSADLFDAEGELSIAEKIKSLAEKHDIRVEEV